MFIKIANEACSKIGDGNVRESIRLFTQLGTIQHIVLETFPNTSVTGHQDTLTVFIKILAN